MHLVLKQKIYEQFSFQILYFLILTFSFIIHTFYYKNQVLMISINLAIQVIENQPKLKLKFECTKLEECIETVHSQIENYYNQAYHHPFDQLKQSQPRNHQQQHQTESRLTYIISSGDLLNEQRYKNMVQAQIHEIVRSDGSSKSDYGEQANLLFTFFSQPLRTANLEHSITSHYLEKYFSMLMSQTQKMIQRPAEEGSSNLSNDQSNLDLGLQRQRDIKITDCV